MQIQRQSSYNILGKIGPHYERPEYHPPRQQPTDGDGAAVALKTDKKTLSTKNTDAPLKKSAPVVSARLNLDSARAMVASTCGLIKTISPQSTNEAPHQNLPTGLMTPIYV
ncbi:hypothetical protein LJB99_01055 [Deltaproteobacteria bacterium OttesenSCG-928-K17]|nr:hypothetical protein [Deltaproteobacteria bacterium OttesenSCG-928-K17]